MQIILHKNEPAGVSLPSVINASACYKFTTFKLDYASSIFVRTLAFNLYWYVLLFRLEHVTSKQ